MGGDTAGDEWRPVTGVLSRDTLAGVALLPPDSDEPVTLDRLGAFLWAEMGEAASQDELTATTAQTFGVDPAVAAETIGAFLTDLAGRGLIRQLGERD